MALTDPVSPQTTVVVILGAAVRFHASAPHLESNVAFAELCATVQALHAR